MDKREALELIREGRTSILGAFGDKNSTWTLDLSFEELGDVDLTNVSLTKANLCGTNLSRAKLSLKSYFLLGATFDRTTKFPKGLDPIVWGAQYLTQAELTETNQGRTAVFISYAWANDDVVLAIDQWLRNKGLNTKLDKRDFFAGSKIRDEIMRVMKACEVILMFYSKDSASKPWPEFERELAGDLEMAAKQEGKAPPRILYLVLDETPLPSVTEKNRIAIMAKGKRFDLVCEEIYHAILQLPRQGETIDLEKYRKFVF